jgi:hypothetical protein
MKQMYRPCPNTSWAAIFNCRHRFRLQLHPAQGAVVAIYRRVLLARVNIYVS